jgi:hypothetical protein
MRGRAKHSDIMHAKETPSVACTAKLSDCRLPRLRVRLRPLQTNTRNEEEQWILSESFRVMNERSRRWTAAVAAGQSQKQFSRAGSSIGKVANLGKLQSPGAET